jgi:hypothetical protein
MWWIRTRIWLTPDVASSTIARVSRPEADPCVQLGACSRLAA